MRILVVAGCSFPAGRGSQLLIERTSLGLLERGHEVELAVAARGEARPAIPGLPLRVLGHRARRPRVTSSQPGLGRALDDLLLALRVAGDGRRPPDVLLGHNVEGGLAAGLAGRWRRLPVVYLRHNDFGAELAHYGIPALSWSLGAALARAAEGLATRTVVLGAPDGADRDWIPAPADPDEAPIAPADGATLYYEGNLDAYQNPAWLELAAEQARSLDPRVRLVCARDPRERPPAADLALLPRTLAGGYPMKLLAYQLAGVPAVCVEAGAPGTRDGLDAFVVPGRGSPDAFARRVCEALADADARRRIAKSARERALEWAHPSRVAALLEACLTRAAQAHSALASPETRPYTA